MRNRKGMGTELEVGFIMAYNVLCLSASVESLQTWSRFLFWDLLSDIYKQG